MPIDDPFAIEKVTARRLRQKSRSRLWQILICLLLAAGAAGLYVYQDAKTVSVRPQPSTSARPVQPTPSTPAPVLNKDQTKIITGAENEAEPGRPAASAPQTAARQIEVGQRPVPPQPPLLAMMRSPSP